VIEVEGLRKRFRDVRAVDDLSFRAAPGAVTGFLGPNGAGKSTTLRSILGLVHADAGSARVLGRRYRDLDRPTERVGAILEASEIHPGRSGRNHLRVLARAAGVPGSRVDEVLRLVELEGAARRRAGGYSLGMRQRLSVAGALLGDPRLLVLDEPANGLDPEGIRWLRDFLRSFVAQDKTVFISSHVLAEMQQLADEVVIIDHGRLVAHEVVGDLTARAMGGTVVRTPDAARFRDLLAGAGMEVTGDGERLIVQGPSERIGELAASNGIVLHELTAAATTLEDAFLELTAGGEGIT
jgi:ABC-2 type transport system ATP-binding protein